MLAILFALFYKYLNCMYNSIPNNSSFNYHLFVCSNVIPTYNRLHPGSFRYNGKMIILCVTEMDYDKAYNIFKILTSDDDNINWTNIDRNYLDSCKKKKQFTSMISVIKSIF